MCNKCNNTGAIVTSYKDGHEDVDLCDCEYNPYTQIKKLKEENVKFRKSNDEKNEFLQELGINSGGEFNRIKYYISELDKQLQACKEENEKLKIKLRLKNNSFVSELNSKNLVQSRWNEDIDTYEVKILSLTQQNKQIKKALKEIIDLKPKYYTCASERTEIMKNMADIAQQALGGE